MNDTRRRWLALYVLCLATLMIVLDTSIVNVALPSIRTSLGFSTADLSWVVNAYLLTFGGFLLLGGRLGDIYGQRRMFVLGVGLFTIASLACSLSPAPVMLIAARAVQGVGGAVASALGLSLVVTLFPEPAERAKAMGIAGFVASGGGAIGVLLGGVLTGLLDWRWIFLVNVPIGLVVAFLAMRLLPAPQSLQRGRLDIAGAITITAALMIAVDAIVNGNADGWTSIRTLGLLAIAGVLGVAFIAIERRVHAPLMPLGLLRRRNLAVANVVGMLWAGAMFAWFFISALWMQQVMGYSPIQVGLAFLPANLIMAALSIRVSGRLVMRYGVRRPLAAGLSLAAAGLALFSQAPAAGDYLTVVLPGMALLGMGAGIAFNPLLLGAMSDVAPEEAGFASGMVNTSFQLGGALGLAILASAAASETGGLLSGGAALPAALLGGYHVAFLAGCAFAITAVVASTRFRIPPTAAREAGDAEDGYADAAAA
jgi:EmrB/QacA subfamily drug resistance transporter